MAAIVLVGLTSLAFAGVGALVAAREPGNAVGCLFLSTGGCIAVTLASIEYVALGFPGARVGRLYDIDLIINTGHWSTAC